MMKANELYTLGDFVPRTGPGLHFCVGDETLAEVLKRMRDVNVVSMPVFDAQAEVKGRISCIDIVKYLCSHETDLEGALKVKVGDLWESPDLGPARDTHWAYYPGTPLNKIVDIFSHGQHRIFVQMIDQMTEQVVIRTVSQSDVLKYLFYDYPDTFSKKFRNKSLHKHDCINTDVIAVGQNKPVIEAFKLMDSIQLTSLPVVEPNTMRLVGTISPTDIRMRGRTNIDSLLNETVEEFLTHFPTRKMQKPPKARPETTLKEAVGTMVHSHCHRVWVVDDEDRPVGVTSMTDVFKILRETLETQKP